MRRIQEETKKEEIKEKIEPLWDIKEVVIEFIA